jgi:hypothetical protein
MRVTGFRGGEKGEESRAKALGNIPQGLKPVDSIGFIGIRRGGKSCRRKK